MTNDGLISGIVSGLLTSFIIFFSAQVFSKILLPWYRELIYKGVDLKGDWYGIIEKERTTREFSLSLNQVGHQLSGICINLHEYKSGERQNATLNLKFDGYVRDGFVYGNFSSMNRKKVVFMMILLRITGAGRTLLGTLVYKEAFGQERIVTEELVLNRKNDE